MPIVCEHVGREAVVHSQGQTWTLARWDLGVWDRWLEWARGVLPDPLQEAEESCLRLAARERRVREELARTKDDARKAELQGQVRDLQELQTHLAGLGIQKRSSYLSVSSPEVRSLLASPRGSCRLLWLLLQPHHPGLSEDDVHAIQAGADAAELERAFETAAGKMPPDAGNAAAPAA